MAAQIQGRAYVLTWHNYTEDDVLFLQDYMQGDNIKYACFGKEICPTTGGRHLQIYICYNKNRKRAGVRKEFPNMYCEVARGDDGQNQTYTSKETGGFFEYGKLEQGKRTDLQRVRDSVKEGMGIRSIIDAGAIANYQGAKMAEMLIKYYEEKRTWKTRVVWLYGDGAQAKAREMAPDAYEKGMTGKNWERYDANESVIWDYFDLSNPDLGYMLGLMGQYGFIVECKFGSRQFLAKLLILVADGRPENVSDANIYLLSKFLGLVDEIIEC